MPNQKPEALQQFEAVDELLTRWLKERRAVLGKYTELAVAAGVSPDGYDLVKGQEALCELLVDYLSAGHFEVYLELMEEAESFGDGSDKAAVEIMPAIADTTEFILAYEEKYTGEGCDALHLERDLSTLGEVLESRFTLEDRMIASLHNSHRRQQG